MITINKNGEREMYHMRSAPDFDEPLSQDKRLRSGHYRGRVYVNAMFAGYDADIYIYICRHRSTSLSDSTQTLKPREETIEISNPRLTTEWTELAANYQVEALGQRGDPLSFILAGKEFDNMDTDRIRKELVGEFILHLRDVCPDPRYQAHEVYAPPVGRIDHVKLEVSFNRFEIHAKHNDAVFEVIPLGLGWTVKESIGAAVINSAALAKVKFK